MNTSHTPAPWRNLGPSYLDNIIGPSGQVLALLDKSHPDWKANRPLIQAAPELLEQCIILCDAISQFAAGDRWPELDAAYAVIAKAKGQ